MNYPYAFFALFGVVLLLTACPPDTRPSDPEPGPADDGGTSGSLCEDENAKIKSLEAELAECKAGAQK